MKLIGSLTSPYVRKIRIVLAEKKIDCEFVVDSPWVAGNQVSQFNPLGKVPVLVLDDASTVYDSRVIAEYLDAVAPNNRLIPASGRERISVKRWEALADGVLDAAVAAFLEARRRDGERSQGWLDRQLRQGWRTACRRCPRNSASRPGAMAACISLADISVGCALGYVSFRLPTFLGPAASESCAHCTTS
jgi:glutathione S-transferase